MALVVSYNDDGSHQLAVLKQPLGAAGAIKGDLSSISRSVLKQPQKIDKKLMPSGGWLWYRPRLF